MKTPEVGTHVRYNDINLRRVGTVTETGRTKHGGNCRVRWGCDTFTSEEMASNLEEVNP